MVKEAERFLKKEFEITQLRVRLHEDNLARIELLEEEFSKIVNKSSLKHICNEFKKLGFCYITLDLEGFRSGSLNEPISPNHLSTQL
jgi:uncharacterized protein